MKRCHTISVALITKDEEANLRELLPQLVWADEIVVVDSGSSDDTAKLARSFGCRVVVHPFDTFAQQRNRAIDLSTGDWVFSLDADERPRPRLVESMRQTISRDDYAAYRIPIRSEILGRPVRWGGTQDDRPVRLFRRNMARWHGDVHERLAVHGAIGQLSDWIDHRTLPTYAAFLEKIDRYTALEAAARVGRGHPPRLRDALVGPPREVFRRLVYKHGWIDGFVGLQFALLSGYSEWVLARQHRHHWRAHRSNPRNSTADTLALTPET